MEILEDDHNQFDMLEGSFANDLIMVRLKTSLMMLDL